MSAFKAVASAATHFRLATRRTARRQALRLLKAKQYMVERGIVATDADSKFEYSRSTGSVLQ